MTSTIGSTVPTPDRTPLDHLVDTRAIAWPSPAPVPDDRVLSGSPQTSTLVGAVSSTAEAGLWRVSGGEFTTTHPGYQEFFVVLEGDGDLIRADGKVTKLVPGAVVTMESGWTGRWVVRQPIVKSYAILREAP